MIRHTIKLIAAYALFMAASGLLHAQTVKVEGAWVRTAVPGQMGTGGYMRLTADRDMTLVGVASPIAGVSEVHEMKMNGDVMSMRAVAGGLPLPAGKTIELKPGGLHLMLMDLKQPLPKDSSVPLTLLLKDKAGKDVKINLQVPVSVRAPEPSAAAPKGTNDAAHHKH